MICEQPSHKFVLTNTLCHDDMFDCKVAFNLKVFVFSGSAPCIKLPSILSYDLHVNVPLPGFMCQRWDSQVPHTHPYTDPAMFPHDGTIADAANYCRNPDSGPLPWCYVTITTSVWVYCHISILNCGKLISFIWITDIKCSKSSCNSSVALLASVWLTSKFSFYGISLMEVKILNVTNISCYKWVEDIVSAMSEINLIVNTHELRIRHHSTHLGSSPSAFSLPSNHVLFSGVYWSVEFMMHQRQKKNPPRRYILCAIVFHLIGKWLLTMTMDHFQKGSDIIW